jgi:hypothetical protein
VNLGSLSAVFVLRHLIPFLLPPPLLSACVFPVTSLLYSTTTFATSPSDCQPTSTLSPGRHEQLAKVRASVPLPLARRVDVRIASRQSPIPALLSPSLYPHGIRYRSHPESPDASCHVQCAAQECACPP